MICTAWVLHCAHIHWSTSVVVEQHTSTRKTRIASLNMQGLDANGINDNDASHDGFEGMMMMRTAMTTMMIKTVMVMTITMTQVVVMMTEIVVSQNSVGIGAGCNSCSLLCGLSGAPDPALCSCSCCLCFIVPPYTCQILCFCLCGCCLQSQQTWSDNIVIRRL